MASELQMVRNLVLVREESRDTEHDSGIYVPAVGEPPDIVTGKVLAAGPDCQEVKPGDRVLYHRFMGTEVLHDEQPALALKEPEVIARWLETEVERQLRERREDPEFRERLGRSMEENREVLDALAKGGG